MPLERQRARRADRSLGAPAVRRGEDLLRRHVREVLTPPGGRDRPGAEAGKRQEPDREIGSGAVESESVEAAVVEAARPLVQVLAVRLPGGDGIVLVQPHRVGDGLPEALHVGLAEDLLRPALVRGRHDRPVVHLLNRVLHRLLAQLDHARPADPRGVEVAHQIGLRIAGDRDDRGVLRRHVALFLEQPGRRPGQRLVRAELDHRLAHVLVAVDGIDVAGAGLVGGARDGADELSVLDQARDDDELPFLHVRAHADGQLRVPLEPCLLPYVNRHSSSWMIGISSPAAVIPTTSTSGPPIMKSVWTTE